jgi:hypothetical protein
MVRIAIQLVIALTLTGVGWAAAKTQGSAADVELAMDAPGGATTITCVRGCKLLRVERGINEYAIPTSSFVFSCLAQRCSSGRLGAWIGP